jgi:hypothetical protein
LIAFRDETAAYDLLWNMKAESIVFGFFNDENSDELKQFKVPVFV